MDGITIVLSMVLCSGNLLSCQDIETSRYAFATPRECRHQMEQMVAALDEANPHYPRAMGRCRYLLGSGAAVELERGGPHPAAAERAYETSKSASPEQGGSTVRLARNR